MTFLMTEKISSPQQDGNGSKEFLEKSGEFFCDTVTYPTDRFRQDRVTFLLLSLACVTVAA
jgi:hypothetical protein